MEVRMSNVQTGHSTVVSMMKIVFDEPISNRLFTTNYLEQGPLGSEPDCRLRPCRRQSLSQEKIMRKILIYALAALIIAAPLSADDFDFGDLAGGDDFGFDMGADSAPALVLSGEASLGLREITGDVTDGNTWDTLAETATGISLPN